MRHFLVRAFLINATALLIFSSAFAADPLLLSDVEMQKLHAYFPAEDENAPLVWKGDPIAISLPIDVEKRIIFPEPIEADLNGGLSNSQLRIINNDQSLYLTALKSFATTRIYVTLKNSHKIVLMDLTTSAQATNTTRKVILAADHSMAAANANTTASGGVSGATAELNNTVDTASSHTTTYVDAIRFAWQQLYAPKRLLHANAGFSRTPMHTQAWVSNLMYGDKVLSHPQVSWLAGDFYVTAVALRNKYSHATTLDLRHDLCGNWQAAVIYPSSHLKPAGDKSGDSATLFLISDKLFGDMLEVCDGGA